MRMHGHGGRREGGFAKMKAMGRGPFGGGFGAGFGEGFGRGFGGGWGGEGGPRGGRGRGRVFGPGQLRLVVLHLLGEQPRHGYDLIKAVEELTSGAYAPSPGVVYPTLNLLTDEGLVTEQAGEGARKAFALTDAGTAELAANADEVARLIERLKALGDDDAKHRAPPIMRAVGNLFAALKGRASTDGFDKETIHAIAEILDEAARKIERL